MHKSKTKYKCTYSWYKVKIGFDCTVISFQNKICYCVYIQFFMWIMFFIKKKYMQYWKNAMTKSLTFSHVIDTGIFHVWGLKNIVAKKFLWQNCLLLVFQMLIRTCSHPPLIETEDMTESNQSEQMGTKVTFKDFIELWDTLFNSPRIKVREPVSLLSHSSVKKNLLQHYIHLCTYQLFSIWVYQLIIFPFWVF